MPAENSACNEDKYSVLFLKNKRFLRFLKKFIFFLAFSAPVAKDIV
jgi:hypothetical protein